MCSVSFRAGTLGTKAARPTKSLSEIEGGYKVDGQASRFLEDRAKDDRQLQLSISTFDVDE